MQHNQKTLNILRFSHTFPRRSYYQFNLFCTPMTSPQETSSGKPRNFFICTYVLPYHHSSLVPSMRTSSYMLHITHNLVTLNTQHTPNTYTSCLHITLPVSLHAYITTGYAYFSPQLSTTYRYTHMTLLRITSSTPLRVGIRCNMITTGCDVLTTYTARTQTTLARPVTLATFSANPSPCFAFDSMSASMTLVSTFVTISSPSS